MPSSINSFAVIMNENSSDFTIVPLKTDFEVRCGKAMEMLFHWTRLQSIPADDESRKEERTQHKDKIFAPLSDSLQVGIGHLLEDGAKQEDFIKLVRAMYGNDAA